MKKLKIILFSKLAYQESKKVNEAILELKESLIIKRESTN
jgi:hypothetical protein